jgi:hypothetical protein
MPGYDLRIEVSDDVGAIGTYGPIILNVAAKPQPVARIRESLRLTRVLEKSRGKIGSYSVVEPAAVQPQPDAERAETNQMMLNSPLTAAALVVEGSGFRAATARTVIAGWFYLKKPYKVKVLSDADEGALWLAAELEKHGVKDLEPRWLINALAQVRAAVKR